MSGPMDAQPALNKQQPETAGTSPWLNEGLGIISGQIKQADLPLNFDIFQDVVKVNSLRVNNPTFDRSINGDNVELSNVKGISLDVSAFGNEDQLPVTHVSVGPDGTNGMVLNAEVQNPLPVQDQAIFGLGKTIDIPLKFNNDGISAPDQASLLNELSTQPGPTIPGMLLSAGIRNMAQITAFADANPVWFNSQVVPDLDAAKSWFEAQAKKPVEIKTSAAKAAGSTKTGASTTTDSSTTSDSSTLPNISTKTEVTTTPKTVSDASTIPSSDLQTIDKPGDYHETMTIGGQTRTYWVHVPPGYDPSKPAPLLVALHGHGEDGSDIQKLTQLNAESDKKGFIVVYPDATQWLGSKDLSAWDTGNGLVPPGQNADDIGFLSKLIDKTQSQLSVDPSRIDLIGFSNGAMFAYLAATEMSDKIASVAIISGAMSGKEPKPAEPISIISTHGEEDPIIPIDGLKGKLPQTLAAAGVPFFQSDQWATNFWKKADGITGSGTETKNGSITSVSFSNPKNGTEVVQDTIANSGHEPAQSLGLTDTVWNFLDSHPKAESDLSAPPEHLFTPANYDLNPLSGFEAIVNKRGLPGTEQDINTMLVAAQKAPDGSIQPGKMLSEFESKAGYSVSPELSSVLADMNTVSKNGNHISFDLQSPIFVKSPVNVGPVTFTGIDTPGNKISFDMGTTSDGNPEFKNIQGIQLGFRGLGQNLKSSVTQISEKDNKDGSKTYVGNLTNPLPAFVRGFLLEPNNLSVGVKLDDDGQPVVDQAQLRNELLGNNPLFRGVVDDTDDISAYIRQPSFQAAPAPLTDVGVTAGSVFLGSRFGWAGAAAGLFLSPIAVHYTHTLIDKL